MSIESGATIADVVEKLAYPNQYVEGVLANLLACKKVHGNAVVRIGISGSGQKPYYWITYQSPVGGSVSYGAYFDNHGPFAAEDKKPSLNGTWSSKSMILKQVAGLYGEMS